MVPLLLAETLDGPLTVERIRDLTAANPAATFGLERKGRIEAGMDADLALYDLDRPRDIVGERLHSKCGWTPFEGRRGVFPAWTLVRGERVYDGAVDTFDADDGENVRP
jgi:dihydroorotase